MRISNAQKTMNALVLMRRYLTSESRSATYWSGNAYWTGETRKAIPGWSWINCLQWLSGAKARRALATVAPVTLAAHHLSPDEAQALLVAAAEICAEHGLGTGNNHLMSRDAS